MKSKLRKNRRLRKVKIKLKGKGMTKNNLENL
jgi:hypothetical protein